MGRLSIDEIIAHCERKVQKIETMFKKEHLESDNYGIADLIQKEYWEHRQVAEWLKELKSYKDAEEQGLLWHLPCPIGTTIYEIVEEYEDIYEPNSKYLDINECAFDTWMLEYVGEYVFLTEEEAKAALKKMRGE